MVDDQDQYTASAPDTGVPPDNSSDDLADLPSANRPDDDGVVSSPDANSSRDPDEIADAAATILPGNGIADDIASPIQGNGASSNDSLTDTEPDLRGVPSRAAIDTVRQSYQLTSYELNGYIDTLRPKLLAQGMTNDQIDDYYGVEKLDWDTLKRAMFPDDASASALDEESPPSFWNDLVDKYDSTALGTLLPVGASQQAAPDDQAPLWQQVSTDIAGGAPDNALGLALFKGGEKLLVNLAKVDASEAGIPASAAAGAILGATRRVLTYLTSNGYCEDPGAAQQLMQDIADDSRKGALGGLSMYLGYEVSGDTLEKFGQSLAEKEIFNPGELPAVFSSALRGGKSAVQGMAAAIAAALSQGQWPYGKDLLEASFYGALFAESEKAGADNELSAPPGDNSTDDDGTGNGGSSNSPEDDFGSEEEAPVADDAANDAPSLTDKIGQTHRNAVWAYQQYGITPWELVTEGINDHSLFARLATEDEPDLSPWFPEKTDTSNPPDTLGEEENNSPISSPVANYQDGLGLGEFNKFSENYPGTPEGPKAAAFDYLPGRNDAEHMLKDAESSKDNFPALSFEDVPANIGPGSYARSWIPAGPNRILTRQEQSEVDAIGKLHGCTRCGTKEPGTKNGSFVGDHQPSWKLGIPKRLYPHCKRCSSQQGGLVTAYLRRRRKNKR